MDNDQQSEYSPEDLDQIKGIFNTVFLDSNNSNVNNNPSNIQDNIAKNLNEIYIEIAKDHRENLSPQISPRKPQNSSKKLQNNPPKENVSSPQTLDFIDLQIDEKLTKKSPNKNTIIVEILNPPSLNSSPTKNPKVIKKSTTSSKQTTTISHIQTTNISVQKSKGFNSTPENLTKRSLRSSATKNSSKDSNQQNSPLDLKSSQNDDSAMLIDNTYHITTDYTSNLPLSQENEELGINTTKDNITAIENIDKTIQKAKMIENNDSRPVNNLSKVNSANYLSDSNNDHSSDVLENSDDSQKKYDSNSDIDMQELYDLENSDDGSYVDDSGEASETELFIHKKRAPDTSTINIEKYINTNVSIGREELDSADSKENTDNENLVENKRSHKSSGGSTKKPKNKEKTSGENTNIYNPISNIGTFNYKFSTKESNTYQSNMSLLEVLYEDSDESGESDSSIDALETSFAESLRHTSGVGLRNIKSGLKRNSKKAQQMNIENRPKSKQEDSSDEDEKLRNNENESDEEVYLIEQNAWTSEANIEYVNQNYQKAITFLQEVVRLDPSIPQSWHTLALIQEELGNYDRALKLYLMSAHLSPSDKALWKRLVQMWRSEMSLHKEKIFELFGENAKNVIKGVRITTSSQSTELLKKFDNARDQLIYCLSKATRADPKDLDLWIQKLEIFEEIENRQMMGICYAGIVKIQPLNTEIVRKALPLFVHYLNDTTLPVKWLSHILKTYWKVLRSTKTKPLSEKRFNYSDLNMLIELRMMRNEYEESICEIKRGARTIQGRAFQTYWEQLELNDEEDKEYANEINPLPIELVVKLGQCRMMIGHTESGKRHFDTLFDLSIDEYADLYQDVANTFKEKEMYNDAITVYEAILSCEEYNNSVIWAQMAMCYKELGEIEKSIEYAQAVIMDDLEEVPMRVFLCEMYELNGDLDSAIQMFSEVEEIRSKTIANEMKVPTPGLFVTDSTQPSSTWEVEKLKYVPMPFFRRTKKKNKSKQSPKFFVMEDEEYQTDAGYETGYETSVDFAANESLLDDSEENFMKVKTYKYTPLSLARIKAAEVVYRRQAAKIRDAQLAFKKIKLLSDRVKNQRSAQIEFCKACRVLFNDWRRTISFYPKSSRKQFTGYHYVFNGLGEDVTMSTEDAYKDIKNIEQGFEKRISDLKNRLNVRPSTRDGYTSGNEGDAQDSSSKVPTTFRGIKFEQWREMFIKYAVALSKTGHARGALAMLETVYDSNVFFYDSLSRATIKLTMLSIAVYSNDSNAMYDIVRWFCTSKPTYSIIYKLYGTIKNVNVNTNNLFNAQPSLKFLRRIYTFLINSFTKNPALMQEFSNKLAQFSIIYNNSSVYNENQSELENGIIESLPFGSVPPKSLDDNQKIIENNFDNIGVTGTSAYQPCIPDMKALLVIMAHHSISTRWYKSAVSSFLLALALDPEDSSLLLSLSSAYQQVTINRRDANTHSKALSCFYYLFQYAKLREKEFYNEIKQFIKKQNDNMDIDIDPVRKSVESSPLPFIYQKLDSDESLVECEHNQQNNDKIPKIDIATWVHSQEVAYNIARTFHGYNILYLAVPYYERALQLFEMYNGIDEIHPCKYTKVAAYNLAQLYTTTGSYAMAQLIYTRYLTI
ncbi:hypothetical protein BB558_003431 [Smittium angustum]|uniref:TPR-like protein n=1 Tax=Smittium angustum TaxID=133377 RepID=A0A2U1J686_SMIAN|nr:hypothetical protein BB558_003431 [Smittium angustum]